jgi:hypothetical protein
MVGSAGAAVGSGAEVSVAGAPQAARIKLASAKAANRTYKFLRIFSFLLILIFIRCHHNNPLLKPLEEQVNIWLIKKDPEGFSL